MISIPQGPIEAARPMYTAQLNRDISIPQGPIEAWAKPYAMDGPMLFQFHKVQLKLEWQYKRSRL